MLFFLHTKTLFKSTRSWIARDESRGNDTRVRCRSKAKAEEVEMKG